MLSETIRVFPETEELAVEALSVVFEHARVSEEFFEFGSLSIPQIMASGLWVSGELHIVRGLLDRIEGLDVLSE